MSETTPGKWDELIRILDGLSECRAHFVVLLAKLYQEMELKGE